MSDLHSGVVLTLVPYRSGGRKREKPKEREDMRTRVVTGGVFSTGPGSTKSKIPCPKTTADWHDVGHANFANAPLDVIRRMTKPIAARFDLTMNTWLLFEYDLRG
jgi:hypothetical protein